MYRIKRTDEEIDAIISACMEKEDEGGSRYPGMTYEQGLKEALMWIVGDLEGDPYGDD